MGEILEFQNLYLVLIDIPVLAILLWYLAQQMWERRFGTPAVNLAFGLAAYVGGHAMNRFFSWYWRFTGQKHEFVVVIIIGLTLTTLGLTCLMRVLTRAVMAPLPPRGVWPLTSTWVVIAMVAAVAAAVVTWAF